MSRMQIVAVWTLSGLLAALYLFAGVTKLAGMQMHVQQFTHWNYPMWFMYAVGAWETLGAILLLVPRTSFYAAILLAINMAGAVYTTAIRVGEARTSIVPAILFVLLVVVACARRPSPTSV